MALMFRKTTLLGTIFDKSVTA